MELHELLPESTEVLFNIAATHEKMGNMDEAVEYYTQAAETPALAYDSWLAIGDIRGKASAWTEAAAAMKKAIEIKAIDPVAMYNYGVYAQNSGDVETAATAFKNVVELDPNQAVAYYQLGLIAVGQQENARALEYFDKFLTIAPDHAQAPAAQGVIDALKAAEANK
jgi:tetratricopeptide (TPR) repeat protein